jgi:DNA-binding transcriptional LysR family regulator
MTPPRKNRNIPPALLRSFLAISEHGSYSKAAADLHLTQPAISRQIKQLQQLVGGDLFEKKGAGVGLTALGSRVKGYAQRILTLNDQVIGIGGRDAQLETIHLGIQGIFSRKLLADVYSRLPPPTPHLECRFICGSVTFLEEKLDAGYVDLVFTMAPNESRRNLLAEWLEKIVWVSAPNFPLDDDAIVPFVGREQGFLDSKVIKVLDDQDVPYKMVFTAGDLSALAAAVEAGIGVMVAPERVIPLPLVVARDRVLPRLPEMRAGVYYKEGFDLKRYRSIVDAFLSAVTPPRMTRGGADRRP